MSIGLPEKFELPNLANFGFDLENRELATLIYLVIIIAGVMMWGKSRQHLGPLLKAFFSPALTKIWAAMTAYTIACVFLLHVLHGWEWENLKTTLVWWITLGFASIWEAQKISDERDAFCRLLRDAVNITAIIVFLSEVKSFPLWSEMILLPDRQVRQVNGQTCDSGGGWPSRSTCCRRWRLCRSYYSRAAPKLSVTLRAIESRWQMNSDTD